MEIEYDKTSERARCNFVDNNGVTCTLRTFKNIAALRFDLDGDYVKFSQEDIKTLLPYLQAFAETGQLEPQESPLQGDDLREAFKPENLIKVSAEQNVKLYEQEKLLEKEKKEKAYCLRQLDQQVDRIADLEELVEEWRDYTRSAIDAGVYEDTDKLLEFDNRASKLLGE